MKKNLLFHANFKNIDYQTFFNLSKKKNFKNAQTFEKNILLKSSRFHFIQAKFLLMYVTIGKLLLFQIEEFII